MRLPFDVLGWIALRLGWPISPPRLVALSVESSRLSGRYCGAVHEDKLGAFMIFFYTWMLVPSMPFCPFLSPCSPTPLTARLA